MTDKMQAERKTDGQKSVAAAAGGLKRAYREQERDASLSTERLGREAQRKATAYARARGQL
jgi:hypothetical protein